MGIKSRLYQPSQRRLDRAMFAPFVSPGARKTFAAIGSAAMLVVAGLHALWIFTPWPLGTRAEFAEVVVGVPEADSPGPALIAAVVVLLGMAAWIVAGSGGLVRTRGPLLIWRFGAWSVGAVLMVRGVGGFVASFFTLVDQPERYRQADLAMYSPFCVGVAVACLLTAFLSDRADATRVAPERTTGASGAKAPGSE